MDIIRINCKGIELIGGYQFWSNPGLSKTEAAIDIVLLRPTLIDLIYLAGKYGVERLAEENDELLHSGCMSELTHNRNARRLNAIKKAKNDQS